MSSRIARILGCGSSSGVPRGDGDWGDCDPTEPKNRRSRCSLLVRDETQDTQILIDTAPDLREQMLAAGVRRIDAAFYTHAHADQTHGIDDLRIFSLKQRDRIPIFADPHTLSHLQTRFEYCFQQVKDYPPILNAHEMTGAVDLGGLHVQPFEVVHGNIGALGYRIDGMAYIPDVSEIPDSAFSLLEGLDLFIVDALRYRPHPSHAHLDRTLEWIERLKPAHAVVTNLHIDMDYRTLLKELPAGVEPAFDGMELRF